MYRVITVAGIMYEFDSHDEMVEHMAGFPEGTWTYYEGS